MIFKHCKPGKLIPGKRPFVIAHRGGALTAPENTSEAIAKTVEFDLADIIEIDVRLSGDKVLVVTHDEKVDRTTDGTGKVSSLTLAQLKRLDAGHHYTTDNGKTFPYRGKGVRIPTLDEVLARFPEENFMVELKDSNVQAAHELSRVLAKHDAFERVVVVMISVKHRTGTSLRKLDSRIKTGHTSQEISRFIALSKLHLSGLFKTRGLTFEVPMRKYRVNLPTPSFIRQAQKKGVSVLVWTINDPSVMHKCIALGVDGIITDDVRTLNTLLR